VDAAVSEAGSLALSTMYFQRFRGATSLAPFFDAGAAMGFERFELSHILPPEIVATIPSDGVNIAAVHHPCPMRDEDERGLSLFTASRDDRAFAAKRLEDSIETATRLGATSVVLHLGRLAGEAAEDCRRLEFELDARLRAGQELTSEFTRAAAELRALLARLEPERLDLALQALLGPLLLARDRGIRVGIETGYSAAELPTAKGMAWMLDRLDDRGLGIACGAWLDTGHVAARAAIGLDGFGDYFEAVGERWVGVHLHDCVRRRDHLAPGAGEVDFVKIAEALPRSIMETCELDWYLGPDEIRKGRDHLLNAGFGS
jgi:sugar phosphate isomerase/epimerase